MTISLVLRFAVRDWRAGELRLLFAALLLAVGAVSAVSLFVDRLQRALVAESTSLLGADRVIDSAQEIPERFRELARAEGLALVDILSFPSMVAAASASGRAEGRNQLASVKAVTAGYPLRGVLRVADAPFGASRVTGAVPAVGEAWLDSRLFPALGIAVGDRVVVGYAAFTAAAVLVAEPDRGGGLTELAAPRLLMRAEDVAQTRVVQPGSRIGYRLGIAGDEDRLAALREAIASDLPPNYRWRSIRDTEARIRQALERAESFLLLGGLLAVLLAGIAVALSANRYARRHFDHVGVLKTLGATPRDVQWGYTGVLLVIGIAGAALGLVLGALVHWAIIFALRGFLPVELPPPGARALYVGLVTGCICLLAFALPPLVALRKVSPMRVMRRDLAPTAGSALTYAFAAVGGLALLVWYSGSFFLTFWALAGGALAGGVFAALALVLLYGGRVVGMQARSVWRLALAGLQRRYRENVGQIMIFGFAIMLLLVMVLVRTALIDEWRAQIPEDTPTHFVMNVAREEADAVRRLLAANTGFRGELSAMVRGRISAVNDMPAVDWWRSNRPGDRRPGPGIRGERMLTVLADLPDRNVVVEGAWWTRTPEAPSVSLDEEYARHLGLSLGDAISFDIGGLPLTATVTSLRRVDWESMQLNFFIIFSPQSLQGLPATYAASFHLPPEDKPFLNRLLSAHPTITVIEVDAVIAQVRRIVARVTQAVELVLYLILAAGTLVLIASIQSSRDQRLREHALLRALGGTRKLISGALLAEFAVLGAFAGIVAALGAEITAWTLNTEVFELSARLHPWLWAGGPALGVAVIAVVGYLSTRKLVASPPIAVLREV